MTNKNPYRFPVCEEIPIERGEIVTQSETSAKSDDYLEVFKDEELYF